MMPDTTQKVNSDTLFPHLRDLPYFRALIRSVEASYYAALDFPEPALDIGCGDGHFASLAFSDQVSVGLDPEHAPLREAVARRSYGVVVQADGCRMPFASNSFASAFSNSVLEHIPDVESVLAEISRLLTHGAPFYFCVPNPRYLSALSMKRFLGDGYAAWFRRISRVHHLDDPLVWETRLARTGFELVHWWHYFSPSALRVLEWGHYFGLPSWIVKKLTGRWILAPARWNLFLTQKIVQRYAVNDPHKDGTFTFFVSRKI